MNEQDFKETMNTHTRPAPSRDEPAVAAVDAAKIRELSDAYVLYRLARVEPGDPVRVLTTAGDVLAAVREVVTDPGKGIRR